MENVAMILSGNNGDIKKLFQEIKKHTTKTQLLRNFKLECTICGLCKNPSIRFCSYFGGPLLTFPSIMIDGLKSSEVFEIMCYHIKIHENFRNELYQLNH